MLTISWIFFSLEVFSETFCEKSSEVSRIQRKALQGTSLIRNRPPPKDYHRGLGASLLQEHRGRRFVRGEVPPSDGRSVAAAATLRVVHLGRSTRHAISGRENYSTRVSDG